MELKYIITDNNSFAIFSPGSEHFAVAKGLWGKPTSAGFCTINSKESDGNNAVEVTCYGKSISLDLQSKVDDSKFLTFCLNNKY